MSVQFIYYYYFIKQFKELFLQGCNKIKRWYLNQTVFVVVYNNKLRLDSKVFKLNARSFMAKSDNTIKVEKNNIKQVFILKFADHHI